MDRGRKMGSYSALCAAAVLISAVGASGQFSAGQDQRRHQVKQEPIQRAVLRPRLVDAGLPARVSADGAGVKEAAMVAGLVDVIPVGSRSRLIYSVQSRRRGVAVADAASGVAGAASGAAVGVQTPVYKATPGQGFALFLNYNPTTGLMFPGTMAADNLGLSDGFAASDGISSYQLEVFRSVLDPQPGLADFHVELWDGDPLCLVDTPGGGFACAPIAGTAADFVDIPADTRLTARAELAVPVTLSPSNTAGRVWMVVTGSQTGGASPCRLGWIISETKPVIGNDLPSDVFELQEDSDAGTTGGTCCIDGLACGGADPPCAFCRNAAGRCLSNVDCPVGELCIGGADDINRRLCTDSDAEDGGFFSFGGTCDGSFNDFCANFTASLFAPAKTIMSWVPVSTNVSGTLDRGAAVLGNTIFLDHVPERVFLEARIGDWNQTPNVCVGGPNDGRSCSREVANDPDRDCPDTLDPQHGGVTEDGRCGLQLRLYQFNLDSSGYIGSLSGTLAPAIINCSTDAFCRQQLGGFCSVSGQTCVNDADCPFGPVDRCEGATCGNFGYGLPTGSICSWGFIATGRRDYALLGRDLISAVDLSTLDARFAGLLTSDPGMPAPDPFPPGGLYAATLVLDVPGDAAGTFTVGLFDVPFNGLLDPNNNSIPLIGLVPARIVVTTGPTDVPKNRFLFVEVGDPGRSQAVKVTFGNLPGAFAVRNGLSMWVGPPREFSEASCFDCIDPIPGFNTFQAARLRCDPFFMDWGNMGPVNVFGRDIVPGATYTVEVFDEADLATPVSQPIVITTGLWGDVAGAFDPQSRVWTAPDGVVEIPIDVIALVDKFANRNGAPTMARAELGPEIVDLILGIDDIVLGVDAFRGRSFPFSPGAAPCP